MVNWQPTPTLHQILVDLTVQVCFLLLPALDFPHLKTVPLHNLPFSTLSFFSTISSVKRVVLCLVSIPAEPPKCSIGRRIGLIKITEINWTENDKCST